MSSDGRSRQSPSPPPIPQPLSQALSSFVTGSRKQNPRLSWQPPNRRALASLLRGLGMCTLDGWVGMVGKGAHWAQREKLPLVRSPKCVARVLYTVCPFGYTHTTALLKMLSQGRTEDGGDWRANTLDGRNGEGGSFRKGQSSIVASAASDSNERTARSKLPRLGDYLPLHTAHKVQPPNCCDLNFSRSLFVPTAALWGK